MRAVIAFGVTLASCPPTSASPWQSRTSRSRCRARPAKGHDYQRCCVAGYLQVLVRILARLTRKRICAPRQDGHVRSTPIFSAVTKSPYWFANWLDTLQMAVGKHHKEQLLAVRFNAELALHGAHDLARFRR